MSTSLYRNYWISEGFLNQCKTLVILVVALAYGGVSEANEYTGLDEKVKAEYLQHFVQFVEWPENVVKDHEVSICIYEDHPITKHVQQLKNESQGEPRFYVKSNVQGEDIEKCNVVFLSEEAISKMPANNSLYSLRNTLVVGEGEDNIKKGAMFSFYKQENKVRIMVNQEILNSSNLKVSSRLLRVCDMVN